VKEHNAEMKKMRDENREELNNIRRAGEAQMQRICQTFLEAQQRQEQAQDRRLNKMSEDQGKQIEQILDKQATMFNNVLAQQRETNKEVVEKLTDVMVTMMNNQMIMIQNQAQGAITASTPTTITFKIVFSNTEKSVTFNASDLVINIKFYIQTRRKIPVDQQRLFFNGKI
jgi:small-conductance mechanosensitive channel